jgi:hypothetical protein
MNEFNYVNSIKTSKLNTFLRASLSSHKWKISVFFSIVLEHLVLEPALLLEFNDQFTLILWCLCWNNVVIVASSKVNKSGNLTSGNIRQHHRILTCPFWKPSCTFCRP